jgi:hypothetical protein
VGRRASHVRVRGGRVVHAACVWGAASGAVQQRACPLAAQPTPQVHYKLAALTLLIRPSSAFFLCPVTRARGPPCRHSPLLDSGLDDGAGVARHAQAAAPGTAAPARCGLRQVAAAGPSGVDMQPGSHFLRAPAASRRPATAAPAAPMRVSVVFVALCAGAGCTAMTRLGLRSGPAAPALMAYYGLLLLGHVDVHA